MKPEEQIRKTIHLIVDSAIDTLMHQVIQALHSRQEIVAPDLISPDTHLTDEKHMPHLQKTRQKALPNDLHYEKAKQTLKRMGWRVS